MRVKGAEVAFSSIHFTQYDRKGVSIPAYMPYPSINVGSDDTRVVLSFHNTDELRAWVARLAEEAGLEVHAAYDDCVERVRLEFISG